MYSLKSFLLKRTFDDMVSTHNGNIYVHNCIFQNQLLSIIFGQPTNRYSLPDLGLVLEAYNKNSYHLGIGKRVTRSNLTKMNQKCDYKIFEDLAYHLYIIAKAAFSD